MWHSSITIEEQEDLERVQKCAVRLIVRDQEKSYEDSLKDLGLESLAIRRENLCTEFAKQCTQNPKTTTWFPKRNHISYALRNPSVYSVTHANTERFKNSTIPYLQRLLNKI